MKDKNKKPIKWYINSILIFLICCTPILMIILLYIGNTTGNRMCVIWSIAIYPIVSIIVVPNTIIHAISDNKFQEEFDSRKEFLDKYYIKVDNTEKYYKIIISNQIKRAVISSVIIITIVFGLLCLVFNFYLNNGPEHLDDRPIILKLFRPSYKVEGRIFLVTMLLLIFGLPSIVYSIASNIHKLLVFRKKKYFCYKVIVENIDFRDSLYIKSTKDTDINKFKSLKKHKKNIYNDYKCIGISKKEVINKEVIMILTPGYVYLLNE